jgi:hypothetical protein
METFQKTDKAIKDQIIHWFLVYHGKTIDHFNGQEEFTLFDKLFSDEQTVINALSIDTELPVLVLKKIVKIWLYVRPDALFILKTVVFKH